MKKQIIGLIVLLQALKAPSQDARYFMDNVRGNDLNDGKTAATAWSSISKLASITFQPGDRIFFKRGEKFDGSLHLRGSGEPGRPVRVTTFGTGERPQIDGGSRPDAIDLLDGAYWQIENIETTGGKNAGIFVGCTRDNLELNHISITNCYAHDIGDTSRIDWAYSTHTGGIVVVNGMFDSANHPISFNSVFNHVVIDDCIVRYNHRWTCITISSGKMNGNRGNDNFIRNCTAEYSSADGIRMNGVRNSKIEYCVMYRTGAWPRQEGRNLGGLGAWFFDGENCTIQFCEAGFVRGVSTDAGAFDIDFWQKRSTVQYCYGHDCAGYGVSIFGADPTLPTENSVVQYNVFSNNGRDSAFTYEGDFFIFTWNGGLLNGVNVHHNVSYWTPVRNAATLKADAQFTGNLTNSFKNNTIFSKYTLLDSLRNDSLHCDYNTYWATTDRPAWQMAGKEYLSLKDWQKATSQDLHSRYAPVKKTIPSWHRYPYAPKSVLEKQAGGVIKVGSQVQASDKVSLKNEKGKLVLLSFITIPDVSGSGRTAAQLAFLKSMKRQYGDKGLSIVLVIEGSQDILRKESMTDFLRDHEFDTITVIQDKGHEVARKYGVTVAPSVFLISGGTIKRAWENLALPAQFAFAIEAELGK